MNNHMPPVDVWTLSDAKDHFEELVRRAQSEGPQRVAVDAGRSVLITAGGPPPHADDSTPFLTFMEGLGLDGLDLDRPQDLGRDVAL